MLRTFCEQLGSGPACVWTRPMMRMESCLTRTFTSDYPKPYPVLDGPSGANRCARLELAAAYRGLDMLQLNEGTNNHLSVMAPRADGDGEVMLVFHEGLNWSQVTASNLVGLDKEGRTVEGKGTVDPTARSIHLAIHKTRPDIRVVMHTHQPYTTALTCLEDMEIKLVHQNSLRFWNRVAYDHNYGGVAFEKEEGERLASILGKKDVLLMANHGALVTAPNISMAVEMLYFLERAAMVQVLAMSTGKKLKIVPEEFVSKMFPQYWKRAQHYADSFFYPMYKLLKQTQPDFEN